MSQNEFKISEFIHIPVQSVDGSLRPPLLQIGACDFRLTPLLSILMHVTQTWREIVPRLPRFRIVAVSMKRLQISVARIAAIPIDMIHLNPVVMLEEQPAVATLATLCFEQPGQSGIGVGMPSLSDTPVHPIAIVRAAVSFHLDMPCDRDHAVRQQVNGIGIGGSSR